MNLDLTSQEMEVLLSITASNAHNGGEFDSVWRKVSAEFVRRYEQAKTAEALKTGAN